MTGWAREKVEPVVMEQYNHYKNSTAGEIQMARVRRLVFACSASSHPRPRVSLQDVSHFPPTCTILTSNPVQLPPRQEGQRVEGGPAAL